MLVLNLIWSKLTSYERRIFVYIILLLVLVLALDITLFIGENSIVMPVEGGILKEAVLGQPVNINPIFSSRNVDLKISALIYSPLQDLLKNIYVSEEGKEYTLELKDNIKWSDGFPISSDDLVFTIETIQKKEANSPLFNIWRSVKAERISAIQTKIYLPESNFLFEKEIKSLQIIPQHIFSSIPPENILLSDYRLAPPSSGPFKFSKFVKRKDGFITNYILEKNPLYEGEKPLIKKIEFIFFENIDEAKKALETHKTNAFARFVFPFDDFEDIKGYQKVYIPTNTYYALFFNNSSPILKNNSLREALIASIDRNDLESAFNDNNIEKNDFILVREQKRIKEYNLPQAQNIISQIKIKNKIPLVLSIVVPYNSSLEKVAEFVKTSWLSAGIDEVNIIKENISQDIDTFLENKNYDILLLGITSKDEESALSFWHSSQNNLPNLNFSFYQNSSIDSLLEKMKKEKDIEEREKISKNIVEKIINSNPAVFLFSPYYLFVYSSNLKPVLPQKISLPHDLYKFFNKWSISEVRVLKLEN